MKEMKFKYLFYYIINIKYNQSIIPIYHNLKSIQIINQIKLQIHETKAHGLWNICIPANNHPAHF